MIMYEFKIVGISKPNKIKLKSNMQSNIIELSKRRVRKMIETGLIKVTNPESLYQYI